MAGIVPELAPRPEDLVVIKNYPSAFFGTTLASTLHTRQIDSLILIGCSTSGCVRATAVDGIQHGFKVIVPRECVGDRHDGPHDASLFRSEEHTSELQSLMRISYAVFCLK